MRDPHVPIASVLSPRDWRQYLAGEEMYHAEMDEYGRLRAEARACLRRIYALTAQLNEMLSIAATYRVPLKMNVYGTSDVPSGLDLVIVEATPAEEGHLP